MFDEWSPRFLALADVVWFILQICSVPFMCAAPERTYALTEEQVGACFFCKKAYLKILYEINIFVLSPGMFL